jgi:hypothetical protein
LRLLLLQDDCYACSFEEVRTVEGKLCDTFASAASKKGLLHDEQAARLTLNEAIRHSLATPYRCRVLLVQVTDAFECNLSSLVEDYLDNLCEPSWQTERRQHVLRELHVHFLANGTSLRAKAEQLYIEAWPRADAPLIEPPHPPLTQFLRDITLSADQAAIRDRIVQHLDNAFSSGVGEPLMQHIEAEAGSGKTFLLQHLIAITSRQFMNTPHRCLATAYPARVARKFPGTF